MEVGVVVPTLVGKLVICRKIVMSCLIHIDGRTLTANLIVFDMEGFDIILEMDWLSNNHAIIDCHNKEIIFRLPDDSKIQICGNQGRRYSTINLSNTGQAITSRRMSSLPSLLKGVASGGDTRGARISRCFSRRLSKTSPLTRR
jgi:hypothetical protein